MFGRVYMWMRPSWDSQYTRTETERATTLYYGKVSYSDAQCRAASMSSLNIIKP